MEEGSDFYVIRKGHMVAVYKTPRDCHAQICSSVSGPAARAYKGRSWSTGKEEYLSAWGLSNAVFVINEAELREDILGPLVPCRFKMMGILHFDGASKGNPAKAGAGAVLMTEDGRVISRLREGLGAVTNNIAEYGGLILGLKYVIRHGFKKIKVHGDSQLVCNQVNGVWKTKNQKMMELHNEVRRLKENFDSFEISHVRREWNAEADRQANIGVKLASGTVSEESGDF